MRTGSLPLHAGRGGGDDDGDDCYGRLGGTAEGVQSFAGMRKGQQCSTAVRSSGQWGGDGLAHPRAQETGNLNLRPKPELD